MQHTSILLLFLALAGAAILIFIYVFRTSKNANSDEGGMTNALRKRFWFILILFIVLGIFASVTIPKSPYFLFADEQPSRVVHIAAAQYYFLMSNEAIDPKNPGAGDTIEINTGELVEFRVTSLDVNHGFAIYGPNNDIVAQTQAMPGYVNRLRWKFTTPGTYNILCSEYCGNGHQLMKSTFTVK